MAQQRVVRVAITAASDPNVPLVTQVQIQKDQWVPLEHLHLPPYRGRVVQLVQDARIGWLALVEPLP